MDSIYAMHTLHGHGKSHEPKMGMSPPWSDNWDCEQMQPAQAYVRPLRMDGVFPPEEALRKGTLFPPLWQPYAGRRQP